MVEIVIRCDTVAKLTTIVISTDISTMAQSLNTGIFKSHFWSLTVSLAGFIPYLAQAQSPTATGNIPATATVVQPLTITNATTLSFGSFVAGAGGSVTIPSTSPFTRTSIARTGTTPLTLIASNAGSASSITVSGVETTYSVSFPASVSLSFGNATMSVGDFTTSLAGAVGKIPSSGTQTFQVGGTLNVNASQLNGVYTGSIPIIITYN
jgi:hypothetical protein